MAKKASISSTARRALVSDFVQKGLIHSQGDVVVLLSDEGIEVTQATASRDLEEVGAVRTKDDNGIMRYLLLDRAIDVSSRAGKLPNQLLLSLTASGNLVVAKTPPGGAQLLASSLDRATAKGELSTVIGTIAGDDTVLIIARNPNGGNALISQLQNFVSGSRPAKSKVQKTKVSKARR